MNEQTQVPGVMLYRHCYEAFQGLSHETVGILTMALMEYAFFAVIPDLPPELQIAWSFLKNYADRDGERYHEKTQRRRDAVEKRWNRERAKVEKDPTVPATDAPHQRPPCVKGAPRSGGGLKQTTPPTSLRSATSSPHSVMLRMTSLPAGESLAPYTGAALDCAPQETEPTYDGLRPYRDEKGIIRYKSVTSL